MLGIPENTAATKQNTIAIHRLGGKLDTVSLQLHQISEQLQQIIDADKPGQAETIEIIVGPITEQ